MFVNSGARSLLLKAERERFLKEEWPQIFSTIHRLGITPKELDAAASSSASRKSSRKER
jgi:GntR family transcriptional regulator